MSFIYFAIIFLSCAVTAVQADEVDCSNTPTAEIFKSSPELRSKGAGEHHFVFKDFPKEQTIDVHCARLVQQGPGDFKKIGKICFSDKGGMLINGKIRASIYGLNDIGYVPGERIKYRFIIPKGSTIAEASYVPKPIISNSIKGTFCVEAELVSIVPTMFQLFIKGLNENETFQYITKVGDEEVKEIINFHALSPLVIHPESKDHKGGECFVRFNRKNGDKLSLKLIWGDEILLYILKTLEQ